jgi:hypothetical protein
MTKAESGGLAMEIRKFGSTKPILCILIIICVVCALFTLTACSDDLDAISIEVVEDSIPDLAVIGTFDISQIKLKVTCEDGSVQEIAVTKSMLDTASKNSLTEAGLKTLNIFYSDCSTTVTIFFVEEGTETVCVTFLEQDGTLLSKKYAVKDGSIETPEAPSVSGMIFDCWRNKEGNEEVDFTTVSSDLTVYASYSENANKYTVTFYDYNNEVVATYTDIAYNSLISCPTYSMDTAIISDYYWNWDFSTDKITQNTSITMTYTYATRYISFKYTYSTIANANTISTTSTTVKPGNAPTDAELDIVKNALSANGLTFVSWLNYDEVKNNLSSTLVALVESKEYTVSYSDGSYDDAITKSGEKYLFKESTISKTGYDFANKWYDSTSNTYYEAGKSYEINSNLTLVAVYEAKIYNANFVFTFEDGTTEDITCTVQVQYDDMIDRSFTNEILDTLKIAYDDIDSYDIDIITYNSTTVSSSGITISSGNDYNFAVSCVDISKGSPNLVYVLNADSTAYLVSEYNPTDKTSELNVVIPEEHENLPVTGINEGVFSYVEQGTNLSMYITLPEGLIEIGEDAFNGVEFLDNISIPSTVSTIGSNAFRNAYSNKEGGITLTFVDSEITNISTYAFADFDGLKQVTLSEATTVLENNCFNNSSDLEEINLNNITEIQSKAFAGCEALGIIGNLNSISKLESACFANTNIITLSLPAIVDFDSIALVDMEMLNYLSVGTYADLGDVVFDFDNLYNTAIKTLVLGERVTSINYDSTILSSYDVDFDESEFYSKSMLSSISFPASMTVINVSYFNQFPLIKTINVDTNNTNYYSESNVLFCGNTLVYYPSAVFGDYTVPSTVNGNSILAIANDAFISSNINKLVLLDDVQYTIGTTSIKSLNILQMNVTTAQFILSDTLFTETTENTLNTLDLLFNGIDTITYYINGYESLVTEDQTSVDTLTTTSTRFIKDVNSITSFYDTETKLNYTVSNNKATITGGDPTATAITIPETLGGYTVSYLGDGAFSDYSYLETLNIEANLANLSCVDTFDNCYALESVTLAGIISRVNLNKNLFDDTLWYSNNIVLVLAGVPIAYNANHTVTIDGVESLIVSASDLEGALLIPEEFFKDASITSIILPSSVTIIEDSAFENCTNLTSIILTNVSTLGAYVFKDCEKLESVTIPNAINGVSTNNGKLSVGIFYNCSALTSVSIPNVNGFLQDANVSAAFYGCSSLEDVSFLSSFTGEIYEQAFYGCSSIKNIDISSSSITGISANAFTNCVGLTHLTMGNISTIGADAFNQTGLVSVRIKGTGGIFSSGTELAVGIFPDTTTIYIDANVEDADVVLANYTYSSSEPRVTFSMLDGFAAGTNTLGMVALSTSYILESPVAPEFDGYMFVDWFVGTTKVEFPYSITSETTLSAKYYNLDIGSIEDSNLESLGEDSGYILNSYTSTDEICYIPSVFISNNVSKDITAINLDIFSGTNVIELLIPEGVTTLSGSLFGSSITYIYIPSSVTEITDNDAFTNTNIDIEWAEDSNLVTAYCSAFTGTIWYSEAETKADTGYYNRFIVAGRLAIAYYSSSTASVNASITVPSQVIKLNDNLFAGATYLITVTLNDNLQIIGTDCFSGATNLETINYETEQSESAITEVLLSAFTGTKWVSSQNQVIVGTIYVKYKGLYTSDTITIPSYITKISDDAFLDASIKQVIFAGSLVTTIGNNAFMGSDITAIILPSSITNMGTSVFENCEDLLSADLSLANITELPAKTFNGCTLLTYLSLNSKVIKLSSNSIGGCSELLTINASGLNDTNGFVESGIYDTAWYNCEAGESDLLLILGKILVEYKAGSNSVVNSDNLVEVVVSSGVEVILQNAFKQCTNIGKITLPSTIVSIEANAFCGCSKLSSVVFSGTELEEIGDYAFSSTSSLVDITLPSGLLYIGNRAFDNSGLESITIPDSVLSIGEYAFNNNASLEELVLGTGLTYIGQYAFTENNSLYKITWQLANVTVDSLTTIEQFYNINEGSSDDANYAANALDYIDTLFYRTSTTSIRMYVPSLAYTFINSIAALQYVSNWNEAYIFDIYTIGDLPLVTFDTSNGYIMSSFNAEVIESLSTPSKTNNTFIRWEVEGEEMTFPYVLHNDIYVTAVWYNNIRVADDNDETLDSDSTYGTLEYSENCLSDGVTTISYNICDITGASEILYVPNTFNSLKVVGFDFTTATELENAALIKKIIFTKASNFSSLDTNIFSVFTNLEEVVLLDSNISKVTYLISDGAMYSIDNTELIAYFIQTDSEDNIITNFTVPETVLTIMPYAFANSGITEITLPSSVVTIGENAFSDDIATINFADNMFMTDVDRNSFSNTEWYTSCTQSYLVNGSEVGIFYAAANVLLTYCETSEPTSLDLPDTVNGYNITVLASNLHNEEDAVHSDVYDSITLPRYLIRINANAFSNIDAYDFDGSDCVSSLTYIADNVFSDTEYYTTNSSGEDLLQLGKILLLSRSTASTLDLSAKLITTLASNSFEASQLTSITLPSTLTYIADEAFYGSTKLTSITIPAGVSYIGESAFKYCTSLKTITFATGSVLTEIGESAFMGCRNLTSIAIPYTVESIGDNAFNTCDVLETVTFDKIQTTVNANTSVVTTSIVEKSNLTSLGISAFDSCYSLTSITIPNNLTIINESTFKDCTGLVDLIFESDNSKVKTIDTEAFYGCTSLGSIIDIDNPSLVTVVLPNALTRVEESAFAYCEGMHGIQFNYNIGYIGETVFEGCLNLAKIVVYADTPPILATNDALDCSSDDTDAYYNLRIYVKTDKVLSDYMTDWSTYASNLHSMGDYATLTYQYIGTSVTDEYTVPENVSQDVYVNPEHTFSNVTISEWTFVSVDGEADDATYDRVGKDLGYAVWQKQYNSITTAYDYILIMDYDIILKNAAA